MTITPEEMTQSYLLPNPFPPEWADGWGEDDYGHYSEFELMGVTQRMRWIHSGDFVMGSSQGESESDSDEIPHTVRISRAFWLADSACSQALWEAVTGENPSEFKGAERPVEEVSWNDIEKFIAEVNSARPYLALRLPTEAEWEYACRAGSKSPFAFGEQISSEQANYDGNYPYDNGEKGEDRRETVEVKALPGGVNAWGLHQMHGNVWEWCADWYGAYPEDEQVDPHGPERGDSRVLRGGSWNNSGRFLRSAYRCRNGPGYRNHATGFRLARGQ